MNILIQVGEIAFILVFAIIFILLALIFRERELDHSVFVGISVFIYMFLLMIPFGAGDLVLGLTLLMLLNTYWGITFFVLWFRWFGDRYGRVKVD